jgi:hypothetical protein
VFVDDNFHYMDEEHRYCAGEFSSYEEALVAAKRIVTDSLAHEGSIENYLLFGEDPFIVPSPAERFSAREYARQLCEQRDKPVAGGSA